MSMREISGRLADQFGLTTEERTRQLPSGRGVTVIHSRAGWAKTYLKQAGLIAQPRRGEVEITDRGRALLAESPERIDTDVLMRFAEFREFRTRSRADGRAESGLAHAEATQPLLDTATAEERIALAAAELELALRQDLLQRLKASDPGFFERVVLDVLRALGYGIDGDGSAEVTGGSGDGGIDGVIEEDRLGLDRVYVQAKRFVDATVGAPIVHAFIGALHMRGATKGVLLTTSTFTKSAQDAARANPSTRVVLIDGDRLAALMIRHNVGVRTERTVEIKKLDFDYFEPDAV
jgi:restriction system protein